MSANNRASPAAQSVEGVVVLQSCLGTIDVDSSIAPIVQALNEAGVPTIASCSGHGHRPGNIALRDGRELIIARNFAEARRIDRLFRIGSDGLPVEAEADLRTERKQLGLTQRQLADLLEITPEHVCRVERGARAYTRAMRFAVAFVSAAGIRSEPAQKPIERRKGR